MFTVELLKMNYAAKLQNRGDLGLNSKVIIWKDYPEICPTAGKTLNVLDESYSALN